MFSVEPEVNSESSRIEKTYTPIETVVSLNPDANIGLPFKCYHVIR